MREYQSVSSLSTFLKCPEAYNLRYNHGVKGKVNEKVEIGSWIHEQLENYPNCHEDAEDFKLALQDYLERTDDEIVEREVRLKHNINGQDILIIIDALTKNGVFIDYKVTTAPNFYIFSSSLQMRLYSYVLNELGMNYKPKYLLFEYKIGQKNNKPFPKLIKLHEDYIPITTLMKEKSRQDALTIVKMIEMCEDRENFPPSMNGCGTCFYKEQCDYYSHY